MAEIADLPVAAHSAPAATARPLDSCAAPPPPALLRGIAEFNAGAYWECHETLEALWVAERGPIRDLYQGILQIGVGFYHLRAGNRNGALKVLGRGLRRLDGLSPACQHVDVAGLARAARAMHDRLAALAPERIRELANEALPTIEMAAASE